jgi:GNAT superfamily N-acetyltransferase
VLAGEKASAAPADQRASAPVLEAILADRSRHLVIAELDGQPAGTADMLIVPNLTHHGMPWAIVENVVVAEAHRRKGVATSVMRHLVDNARAAGCFKVELLSGKHRAPAHALYRSVGLHAVSEGFKIYFDA